MSNFQISTPQSFGYQHVKEHGEEGGGQVGEAGDHEGVGISEKFLLYVVEQVPMSA